MWTTQPNFSSYIQDYPMLEAELVQLSKGPLNLKSEQIFGKDAFFAQSRCSANTVWHMSSEKGWVALWLPMSWKGEYSFNGSNLRSGEIVLVDSDCPITTASCERHGIVIGIRRTVFEATCRKLSDRRHFALPRGHRLIYCNGQERFAMQHYARSQCNAFSDGAQIGGKHYMSPMQEADTIAHVASWVVDCLDESAPGPLKNASDYRVFAAALDAITRKNCQTTSMADLCEAAGVGKTRLHQCFYELYGISPMHFLMKLRLTKVREGLLDPEVPFRSVKEAALTHGFSSLGRFSGYYNTTFGEFPSQTLQRSANGG